MITKKIMRQSLLLLLLVLLFSCKSPQENESSILIEAESFQNKGGWMVDPQYVEQMGSPYLLAHGLGQPVNDAEAVFQVEEKGKYNCWVRTMNWAPGEWQAPGRFQIIVNDKLMDEILGSIEGWSWQYAGNVSLEKGENRISLKDLTGFDGRCDAVFFSTSKESPPDDFKALEEWRNQQHRLTQVPEKSMNFDLVITGGGIAGCAAAIAAAEEGMKVALIHDRPVLGGNASGEIRVHTLGIYGYFERILKMLDTEHYPNGDPKAHQEDEGRLRNIQKYENIKLYLNWRAYDAFADDNEIEYVDARQTSSGERLRFTAPLFVDCTGDGWIGYWAGAEYNYGRESVYTYDEGWDEHGELWSPEEPDSFVMGASILWRSQNAGKSVEFPKVPWALEVSKDHSSANGEWYWEYSSNELHQVEDAEKIRDHMLKAIYGSFYNEKQKEGNDSLELQWVGYLLGKRESRRLTGDYIFSFKDVTEQRLFPDAVVMEDREVDVHYQQFLVDPSKPDFLSEALFYKTPRYYIPYRSLYSKNINNLFMAGRCFSCSHVGLGGPRVMRTTGQMGAAVGYAASICKKHNVLPRDVYEKHLDELMQTVNASDTYNE
ncbi:MAG: FAD-dependent oxidoreductase [Bacteroidales bacterium]